MKTVRLIGKRDLQVTDEPVVDPKFGEVTIQVKSVGVCASDGHWYRDGRIGSTVATEPLVLGHEASGVIAAVGSGVANLNVGDRVAIEPAKPCMQCEFCKAGYFNVCPNVRFFGTPPTDGCFREFVTWPAHLALKVPDAMSFDEVAMLEPLAVGVYAVDIANEPDASTIVVLGAGAIGLSVIQSAKLAGAGRIIVSEPIAERRKLALTLGADEAFEPASNGSANSQIHSLTNGRGADVAYECTGVDGVLNDCCKIIRPMGKIIIIGIPDQDVYEFDASNARRKQITAIFVRRSNETTLRSMELVTTGQADVSCYATHRFDLDHVGDALELMFDRRDGVVRAIVSVGS